MAGTTISQNRLNNGKIETKITHEMNQSTNSVTKDTDIDDEFFDDDQDDDEIEHLKDTIGMYVGARCNGPCDKKLHHVTCDKSTSTCVCEKKYPVMIGRMRGCAKPKKLGEQCFYDQTCMHNDINSLCLQVRHNALCQCIPGFHSVSYLKPTKRIFCTEDMSTLTSDLPTLLSVTTGIAVLASLICLVLHLFSKTKYPRHRNFNNSNLPPPILYSSDTVHSARPSSRSSIHSNNSVSSFSHRRPSSAPHTNSSSKGVLVSTSRSGAARSAAILLISSHISASHKREQHNSDENMTKHLQNQLRYQRQQLHLELPPNTARILTKLLKRGCENEFDDDFNSLGNGNIEMNAVPSPACETARVAVKSLESTHTLRVLNRIQIQFNTQQNKLFFNFYFIFNFSFFFKQKRQQQLQTFF